MTAPTLTYDQLVALKPCRDRLVVVKKLIGDACTWNGRQITAKQAREAGVSFDDILWVASEIARTDTNINRRLLLWATDCAARVLPVYESAETSTAPRDAIVIVRRFAKDEIDISAWDAVWGAARRARRAARATDDVAARAAAEAAADVADAAADATYTTRFADASCAAIVALTALNAAWDCAKVALTAHADPIAESHHQFDRLIEWLSDTAPQDWPLPALPKRRAA